MTTIGYGDVVAVTGFGRIFTICLVLVGLSALTFFLSSSFALLFSVEATARRRRRRVRKKIAKLGNHYIICGSGEMVDKTIGFVLQSTQIRRKRYQDDLYGPIKRVFDRMLGAERFGRALSLRKIVRRVFGIYVNTFIVHSTLLDVIVVVTEDPDYAEHLRSAGILVVEGDPTDNERLNTAGIARARAVMVMLDQDSEGLLTVLTARNLNPAVHVTAATVDAELRLKMIRAGANVVLAPYEVAGQFLNSATLRPAVNDYFNSIIFDQETQHQVTQLELGDDSPWIGKRIGELRLRDNYDAAVIGIRKDDGDFVYAPGLDRILADDEILLAVAPGLTIPRVQGNCRPRGQDNRRFATFQRLAPSREIKYLDTTLDLIECEAAIATMSKHFIICGNDHIMQSAVRYLDPSRPFVLMSNDNRVTREWLDRGFRVIHGDPAQEESLKRAGVERAQAIMISIGDKASAVLAVISARSISRSLLVAVTATSDDMIEKLKRSGADRVVSPFHVAAQFVLLSTTRPEIAEFLQHVLYNEVTGLETAELYMEHDSPWIGKTIETLDLMMRFRAGVIGIRESNSRGFLYAPPLTHVIQPNEVLIVVTPMEFFDEMRAEATGDMDRRPATLRLQQDLHVTGSGTRDFIRELIKQHE